MSDTFNDFNEEVFQDAQEDNENIQQENIQQDDQTVQEKVDQNVQDHNVMETVAQNDQPTIAQNVQDTTNPPENVPNEQIEHLSADLNPLASGSLPSAEVQLLAQKNQNVNVSTLTMGSTAGINKYLVSPLPTPNIVPLSPPPITKTNKKLPDIPDLFESLDTFVSSEGPSKEKAQASAAAPPAKPSRAEKLASRALRVSTKTHKIACVLANWTVKVHAPCLAIPPHVFYDPSIFESEPSSDSGDSTP